MKLSTAARVFALGLSAFTVSAPASAEVTRTTDDSFVSRNEVVVEATPKDVWLALISPAIWWQSAHTWSGDAKNLTLVPQAGGCFCETIPEVDEPGRFTLQGSVEHMRVVQAYPEAALRMVGSLGPLQSEPATGVLTIVISEVAKGTRIVFEYNVGGPMRYEIPVISKAVDGVMSAQIASLAKPLGVVAEAPPPAPEAPPSGPTADKPAGAGKGAVKPAPAAAPAAVSAKVAAPAATAAKPAAGAPATVAPATTPTAKPDPKLKPKTPSVEDAFGDLGDKPEG